MVDVDLPVKCSSTLKHFPWALQHVRVNCMLHLGLRMTSVVPSQRWRFGSGCVHCEASGSPYVRFSPALAVF